MRAAIFSDIHGNLPALEAVLDDIARRQVDAIYCLGDLVGYAPFPNEVTERIRREQRMLLPDIRTVVDGKRLLLVHGSPRKMNEYLFEDRPVSSFARIAASSKADVIVFGHTHKPYVKQVDGVWFVNVGSVGKPKDGNWHACYAILEVTADPPAAFVRVSYDINTVTRALRASELPHMFADDLETGGAPNARHP
jgi:putative phosphoesterase